MKVVLVRTYYFLERFYVPRAINEPLNLEYLAAVTRDRHQVAIVDGIVEDLNNYRSIEESDHLVHYGMDHHQLVERIVGYCPDVVGITWMFPTQNLPVNRVAEAVKSILPGCRVIVGGPHPSGSPDKILKENESIDMVLVGEGEETFRELLDSGFSDLHNIEGIVFRENGKVVRTRPRHLIKSLDDIPFPARDMIRFERYSYQSTYLSLYHKYKRLGFSRLDSRLLKGVGRMRSLNEAYFRLHNRRGGEKLLPAADIITSRGCPNRCTFCAIGNVWSNKYRMRSPESVLKEINLLAENYGVKHFNIQDDNFNVSRKRTIEICRGIAEMGRSLTFEAASGLYISSLDREVLTWLKRAGFNIIRLSIESGNQDALRHILNKRIDLEAVPEIIRLCKEIGIKTEGAFMIGLPGETIEAMKNTVSFARECGFDAVKLFIYQPFPNTVLYERCRERNYITDDFDITRFYVTGRSCYLKTEEFAPEDVIKIARESRLA